jgi:RimJ/RimL family protein N-acetyltransferase
LSNPSEIAIRILTPSDADAYRAFRLRGLREHPEAFRSSFEEESTKDIEETRQRLTSVNLFGAFDANNRLVGAVGLRPQTGIKTRHIADVIGMYVVPESAGKRVGKALLQALIEHARSLPGVLQLMLTVTDGNERAQHLYEEAGFRVFGTEPRAIRVDERYFDKAHMVLFL